ncbi:MAG: sigma-70 family RNA polymerase sigma factor [Planctomycetota bacterium]|nr:sigma-70 family RNA polymerase sigma factor [Planctomycetota bacterium]
MPTTAMMINALVEMRKAPGGAPPDHFWQLVERFRADLVNQALAILGQQADAEDVAQESLCQAFQDLHTLDDPQRLGFWLRSINRCNALDLLRKRSREKVRPSGRMAAETALAPETTPTGSNLEHVRRTGKVELVARAVDSLPEPFREVVVLRYWEKKSYEELAQCLGVPMGTVKSRLARADGMLVAKLRKLWAESEGGRG